MPTLDEYRVLLAESRARIVELKRNVTLLTTEWMQLEKKATMARRALTSDPDAEAVAAAKKAELLEERANLEAERANADNLVISLYGSYGLRDLLFGGKGDLPGISVQIPIVLLPLRIETRFKVSGTTQELWIRVYPDTIHVDSHEPELSDDEVTWGKHFWQLYYTTKATVTTQALAWKQLVDRYGEPRAAWIVKTLTPQVKAPKDKDKILSFPTVDTRSASGRGVR